MAADDLGDACVFVMKHYSGDDFLNAGTGEDITIGDFAKMVADVVGFKGTLKFDTSRPDGPPQKLLGRFSHERSGLESQDPSSRRTCCRLCRLYEGRRPR